MPIDYGKLLAGSSTPTPSTFGMTPEMIANFAGQRRAASANRNQLLMALAGKEEAKKTYMPVVVNGKTYNVPPSHYANVVGMQNRETQAKAKALQDAEQAKVKAAADAVTESRKAEMHSLQAANIKARTEDIGQASDASGLAGERLKLAQTASERKIRIANRVTDAKVMGLRTQKGDKGAPLDLKDRLELATLANEDPNNPKFYFEKITEKTFDPLKKSFHGFDKHEMTSWEVPKGKTFRGQPATKGFLIDQWLQYNEANDPIELEDFLNESKLYFK